MYPAHGFAAVHRAALLYGRYVARVDTAIILLQGLLEAGGTARMRDEVKLHMGEMSFLANQPWEAMLWYIQVEKDQKHGPLYEEAKLHMAKISLYQGAVTLAQGQLNIVAAATTQRIANDALALLEKLHIYAEDSVAVQRFVQFQQQMDVYAYDSAVMIFQTWVREAPDHTGIAFTRYLLATALVKAGRHAEALQEIDLLLSQTLFFEDEVLWLQARITEENLKKGPEAYHLYITLIKLHPESILVPRARARLEVLDPVL